MRAARTLDEAYFEGLFAADPDPWDFETSRYEAAKYAATIAALGPTRARSALEVGCANGVLTVRLAAHCDRLRALDISPTALAQAQARCKGLRNVDLRQAAWPQSDAPGAFDLFVLSEVAYYWDDRDAAIAAARLRRSRLPHARLLMVHWTGPTNYPVSGDRAVARLAQAFAGEVEVEVARRAGAYRLDLWRWR